MSKLAKTDAVEEDWTPHHDRRTETRHDAMRLGPVTARLIGGSEVKLVNFSNRGVLVESDSRLQIGARASIRITTKDASVVVTGKVVRSRVKGLVNGVLLYDAGLNLDSELSLATAEMLGASELPPPAPEPEPEPGSVAAAAEEPAETWSEADEQPAVAVRQTMDDEVMVQLFASVPQDLAELRRLAADNQW
jgi:hypothetical protein